MTLIPHCSQNSITPGEELVVLPHLIVDMSDLIENLALFHRTVVGCHVNGRLEVDLVARDGPCLVLVEVKARTEPVQAGWHRMVSKAQQERLIRAARAFLAQHPDRSLDVRFDVIAVLRNRYGHRVLHTQDAFYPLIR